MKTFPARLIMSGLLLAALPAHGGSVPGEVNYQGQILNATGTPLATGNYILTFTLYDAAQSGNVVWGLYTNSAVAVVDGSLNVVLPAQDYLSRTLAAAAANSPRFLEVRVGNNPPIAPRQQLLSAPFALNSERMQGYGWDAFFDNANPATGKIAGSRIADASLTTSQLASNAVTSAKILDGTITSADIADATIANVDLTDNVVTSAKIADGTIQQADLGIVYRLTASDGSPTNALQVDLDGNVTVNGGLSTTSGLLNGAGISSRVIQLGGFWNTFAGISAPATIVFEYSTRIFGQPLQYTRIRGEGTTLALDCNSLIVTNVSNYSGSPYPLYISASGTVMKNTSSMRYKVNIEPLADDYAKLLSLQAKQYVRKESPGCREIGYIAEDLDALGLTGVTVYDAEGRPDGIDYSKLIIYANEVLKDQQKRLKSQEQEIQSLKGELEALKFTIRELGKRQQ
ncbi:MAG: tail fiber domain-containing protein [Verrucomicrobia bacterium]|nr:tail fiber domain-containing protein [Verrucomicrobiota bacterium]